MSNSEIIEQNNQKISELTELVKTKAVGDTSKFLKLPDEAPTETKLVAVDNTNAQTMLSIGDGLSIENDVLKASGGKLYEHFISINYNSIHFNTSFYIISKSNTPLSNETLLGSYLNDRGFNDYNRRLNVYSNDFDTQYFKSKTSIFFNSTDNCIILFYGQMTLSINENNEIIANKGGNVSEQLKASAGAIYTDIVKEI